MRAYADLIGLKVDRVSGVLDCSWWRMNWPRLRGINLAGMSEVQSFEPRHYMTIFHGNLEQRDPHDFSAYNLQRSPLLASRMIAQVQS
jgi:hypothetical protein